MINQCGFENCNQVQNHVGPHSFAIGDGLVLGPHGGGEGILLSPELTDLLCDCCGHPMMLHRGSIGGGIFRCSSCGQDYSYSANGYRTSRILARLYPSNMKENSELYREYVDYTLSGWLFDAKARFLLGLYSAEEYAERIVEAQDIVDKWYREHPHKSINNVVNPEAISNLIRCIDSNRHLGGSFFSFIRRLVGNK